MGKQIDLFANEEVQEQGTETIKLQEKEPLNSTGLVLSKKNTSQYVSLNKKIQKLQKEKKRFQTKMELIQTIFKLYNEKIQPLEQVQYEMDEKYIVFLDKYMDKKSTSKKYKELANVEIRNVINRLTEADYQSATLNDLIEKNKKEQYDSMSDEEKEQLKEEFENMKSMFKDTIGKDIPFSFDDFLNKSMEEIMGEQQERIMREMAEDEVEEKQELKKERQSFDDDVFKKLYKKLAKILHPDTNIKIAVEDKKEELIRELSEAWEERNYMKILEINALVFPDDSDFNFTEQQIENIEYQLKEELRALKSGFREISGSFSKETAVFNHFYSRSAKKQTANFFKTVRELKEEIDLKKSHHEKMFNSVKNTKEHLDGVAFMETMMMLEEDDYDMEW